MSAALTDVVESLHITAARKLAELIQAETDPHLLAKLIATAFRYKAGKLDRSAPAPTSLAEVAPDNNEGRPDSGAAETPPPHVDGQTLKLIVRHAHDANHAPAAPAAKPSRASDAPANTV